MINLYFISCVFFLFPALYIAQDNSYKTYLDSLKKELLLSKTDTTKIKLLDLLAFNYSKFNYDEGIKYAQQAESLSIKANWKKGIASSNLDLGINYMEKCNYPIADFHYLKALKTYKELGDKRGMISVYANIGLLHMAKSDYAKALENDFKALSIAEELNDIAMKAIILENIGTAYLEQKNYSKTLNYYSLAIENYKKVNNKEGVSRNLGNQGIILNEQGKYDKALNYHLLALKTNQETGRQSSIQISLANIGITYSYLKKYSLSLNYYLKALNLSRKLGDARSVAINHGNIGELYFFMAKDPGLHDQDANVKTAIKYLDSAITACKKINFDGPNIEFSKILSEAYLLAQDYKKAFGVFKDYSLMKDSVFSQESRMKIAAHENKRQLEIKNKDILLKDRQLQIEQLKLTNKQNERVIFLITIGLLFIIIFLLYRLFRLRNKTHKRVLSDIANIQSHEVRGPVARILGLSQLFDKNDPAAEINKEVIELVHKSAIELDDVIRKTVNKATE
ncbi:MAG: tetratricopeptide repeat protein [Bacteroidota bacterium]|nr:tetratricopeptide repeat protein [Bacteroidota bacterium]